MIKIILVVALNFVTLTATEVNTVVNPKIDSSKKNADSTLLRIEDIAKEGKVKKFPTTCAKLDSSLLKYTFPEAPKEVKEYYDNAQNICYGKLHILALEAQLKKEGASVCKSMEVTLQIRHFKSYLKKQMI